MPRKATRAPPGSLAVLLLCGFGLGAWWPVDREASRPAIQEKVFVLSEDVLQALPPLGIPAPAPQPPAPSPPKEKVPEIKPPLKQKQASPPKSRIDLEAADLSEIGDLAIARENIQDKEAEAVVARPTPTRPSAPVFLEGQPGILKGIPPEYPPRALERGLEGTVVAQVTIDTNGQVTEARIARSAGRDFDESVLDAVRRLRFQPLIREGRKWPARFRIPYEFRLE